MLSTNMAHKPYRAPDLTYTAFEQEDIAAGMSVGPDLPDTGEGDAIIVW